jgi:TPR repeat protein
MEEFRLYAGLQEKFAYFERAAAKGHEESIWFMSVAKDVEIEQSALKEAFAKTGKPLGWHLAGKLSVGREQFDFFKKSAEGGCSWGQVEYGGYFETGMFVEEDSKVCLEWLGRAANQNNPLAMNWLGDWFRWEGGDDKEEVISSFRAAAELGWKNSMFCLSNMLRYGEGCDKDLRQTSIWSAKGNDSDWLFDILNIARVSLTGSTENLTCDLDHLCYTLGWGLYWYQYGSEDWNRQTDEAKAFGNRCLDYYCSCVELQRKSIFTFLWFGNQTTGVKGPGQIIGQMVWEQREDSFLKSIWRE